MTQTTFTDNVEIQGSRDVDQLKVKGWTTQDEPLQTWENSAGDVLAQITGDGRLQLGDDLGLATADSLVEAHRDESSTKPARGFHALGRLTGALDDVVSWIVQELELLGIGGISALHSALRVKLTNSNTGTMNGADLRAGDFEVVNDGGSVGSPVNKLTGLQVSLTNDANGYVDEAVGLRVAMANDGQIAKPYAIYTDLGTVHLGDDQELKVFNTAPTANPPAGFIRMYPKSSGGVPKLYAKDTAGIEHELGGGGSGANGSLTQKENFTQATASPLTLFTPPPNSTLHQFIVEVNTPAAGGNPTIAIGISGDEDKYMNEAESDLKTAGIYIVNPEFDEDGTPDAVIVTITPDSQMFAGMVYAVYSNPA